MELTYFGKGREGKGVSRLRTRPKFVFHCAVGGSTWCPLRTCLNHQINNTRSHSLTDTNHIYLHDTCFNQAVAQCHAGLN